MEDEEKELTDVTKELLERTSIIKNSIMKSMIVGECNILKGVIIFEAVLKEINPVVINENEINKIDNTIKIFLIKKEESEQKVNKYIHHGIDRCIIMLDMYYKSIKRLKK